MSAQSTAERVPSREELSKRPSFGSILDSIKNTEFDLLVQLAGGATTTAAVASTTTVGVGDYADHQLSSIERSNSSSSSIHHYNQEHQQQEQHVQNHLKATAPLATTGGAYELLAASAAPSATDNIAERSSVPQKSIARNFREKEKEKKKEKEKEKEKEEKAKAAQRKAARLKRNAESARRIRRRKKAYVADLEARVRELERENKAIREVLAKTRPGVLATALKQGTKQASEPQNEKEENARVISAALALERNLEASSEAVYNKDVDSCNTSTLDAVVGLAEAIPSCDLAGQNLGAGHKHVHRCSSAGDAPRPTYHSSATTT